MKVIEATAYCLERKQMFQLRFYMPDFVNDQTVEQAKRILAKQVEEMVCPVTGAQFSPEEILVELI